jgi:hypothetical protein
MAGKIKELPWWENYSPEDFQRWYEDNPVGFKEYVAQRWSEWNEEQAKLEPGMPNRLAFENAENDVVFQSKLRRWENEQTQENFYEKHKPIPQPGPVDRDFLALSSRDKTDQKTAAEILRNRAFVDEQSKRAIERQALGDEKGAREATARASMMTRQVEQQRQQHRYTFLEQVDNQLVKNATNELERALSLSPEEVNERREYYQGLITAFNATHDGAWSYVIDGFSPYDPNRNGREQRIIKVEHDGLRACDVARTAENRKMTTLDHLITVGYGKAPEAEKEETPEEETSPEAWEKSLRPVV